MASTAIRLFLSAAFLTLVCLPVYQTVKSSPAIQTVGDVKDFKKILKTKINVLVFFSKTDKYDSSVMKVLNPVAEEMKGKAIIVLVDCSDAKKLCKKYKASSQPSEILHFHTGEFNKAYDRKMTVESMKRFLLDPKGDAPWEEDDTAIDVAHTANAKEFYKLLKKSKVPVLAMFYTPWCGYCKMLKPEFSAAASELRGQTLLLAADVDRDEHMQLRTDFNITGFPTLLYFENGKMKFKYGGENSKDGILKWLQNPQAPKEPEKETEWADEESSVVHLNDENFTEFVANKPSVLVMFYAPWCGHCKKMKPEYTEAAEEMKEQNIDGILAAVDATKAKTIAEKYAIKGFPTVKFFKDGEELFDVNERTKSKIITFMKDPKQPPPPPKEDASWEEMETDVVHLTADSFKNVLKKKRHSLVMFYAPWCGHCKKAKPEFNAAAAKLKDNSKVMYAAVDCTKNTPLCTANDVSGYPTIKYFNYGKDAKPYNGGREEADFVAYMFDLSPPEPSIENADSDKKIDANDLLQENNVNSNKNNDKNDNKNAEKEPGKIEMADSASDWSEIKGADNLYFLTDDNFDLYLATHESSLIMFYAPWCGHCKNMKPAFAEAAQTLAKDNFLFKLAVVDATIHKTVSSRYEVKSFPKLKYFKNGEFVLDYKQQRKAENFINFAKNPDAAAKPPPPATPTEDDWSSIPGGSDVNILTDKNFDDFLKSEPGVLVMFYAPWCGHCKKMKPAYSEAAASLKVQEVAGKLAAIDATQYRDIGTKFQVRGYPTLKYFENGVFKYDYTGKRSADDFIKFIKNPKAPPPPEPEWQEVKSAVHHLTVQTYDSFLAEHKGTLVMFYAPWCGHCKTAKPFFQSAADEWNGTEDRQFAAVDCTKHTEVCEKNEVKGYPTFIYILLDQLI